MTLPLTVFELVPSSETYPPFGPSPGEQIFGPCQTAELLPDGCWVGVVPKTHPYHVALAAPGQDIRRLELPLQVGFATPILPTADGRRLLFIDENRRRRVCEVELADLQTTEVITSGAEIWSTTYVGDDRIAAVGGARHTGYLLVVRRDPASPDGWSVVTQVKLEASRCRGFLGRLLFTTPGAGNRPLVTWTIWGLHGNELKTLGEVSLPSYVPPVERHGKVIGLVDSQVVEVAGLDQAYRAAFGV